LTWPPPESLVDVVVGGLIAGLGGFLAVVWVRWRDSVAEDRRFQAAVLTVLDELKANEVNIEHLLAADGLTTFELHDSTFRSVELLLASHLGPADRNSVADAYAPLRSRWSTEKEVSSADWVMLQATSGLIPDKDRLKLAAMKMSLARAALAEYVPRHRMG